MNLCDTAIIQPILLQRCNAGTPNQKAGSRTRTNGCLPNSFGTPSSPVSPFQSPSIQHLLQPPLFPQAGITSLLGLFRPRQGQTCRKAGTQSHRICRMIAASQPLPCRREPGRRTGVSAPKSFRANDGSYVPIFAASSSGRMIPHSQAGMAGYIGPCFRYRHPSESIRANPLKGGDAKPWA